MLQDAIRDLLVRRGKRLLARPREHIPFTGDEEADSLLNDLDHYPHAFVLACLMDYQIKAEKAWLIPHKVRNDLGSFEFSVLESVPLRRLRKTFAGPPSLHRFPDVTSRNFFRAVKRIGEDYQGDASAIWSGRPSSAKIVRRFLEFDGAGPKIATMAANILVRQFKIPVSDKFSIDLSPDVQVRRVFTRLGLIRAGVSQEELVYRGRELNPRYPGVFDSLAWEIGRNWCRPRSPKCRDCYMSACCPTALDREKPA